MSEQQATTEAAARGPGSFCIPRAALEALLDAGATVTEIGAYLVLARFTEVTGRYSTASIAAINRYTGTNKTRGGPVHNAVERLKTIRASTGREVPAQYGYDGKPKGTKTRIEKVDRGPILIDRATWCAHHDEALPDGPTERGKVHYVLPDFGEPLDARTWFGGNLVTGINHFDRPLRALKNAGNVASRLLLAMYAANDMETWGGRSSCRRW